MSREARVYCVDSWGMLNGVSSVDGERADVVPRRRRGWLVVYLVGLAAVCYFGTVGIHHMLGRADIWFHGLAGLGPVIGVIAVEWWKRRRRRRQAAGHDHAATRGDRDNAG